jgi:hypothetical protein
LGRRGAGQGQDRTADLPLFAGRVGRPFAPAAFPARQAPAEVEAEICELRRAHPRWSPLTGGAIPLGSRIVAACAALLAMTSNRPHAPARNIDSAAAEIRRTAGTQFDPQVVTALLQILDTPGPAGPAADPYRDPARCGSARRGGLPIAAPRGHFGQSCLEGGLLDDGEVVASGVDGESPVAPSPDGEVECRAAYLYFLQFDVG